MDSIRRRLLAAAAALPATGLVPAWAQEKWPTKPIKLLVGFPPGGGADAMARLVGAKLPEKLGQPVVVDNKTGATGTICSESRCLLTSGTRPSYSTRRTATRGAAKATGDIASAAPATTSERIQRAQRRRKRHAVLSS